MSSALIEAIQRLPQAEHLPESRIHQFLQKLSYLGEDQQWHVQRLSGFGGSEMGALLRHRFGVFAEAPGDSFKNAEQVVMEKLLRQLPMKATPQAKRGTDLEPLVKDVFRKRYHLRQFDAGQGATRKHSSIGCLQGNVDDSLTDGTYTYLPDYKTCTAPYAQVPFDYRAQLHTYSAIARSNGVDFDRHLIVGFHAAEPLLQGLAQMTNQREGRPDVYARWVEHLAQSDVPGLELRVYPVKVNRQLELMIEDTARSYWSEYVLKGQLIPVETEKMNIPEEKLERVKKLLQQAAQVLAAQKVSTEQLSALSQSVVSAVGNAEPASIKWPADLTAVARVTRSFDAEPAIAALEAENVLSERYMEPTGKLDVARLAQAYEALGGDLSAPELQALKPNNAKIKKALKTIGVDSSIYESSKLSLQASARKAQKQEFTAICDIWNTAIAQTAMTQPDAVDDDNQQKEPEELSVAKGAQYDTLS